MKYKNNNKDQWMNDLIITNHFIDRYVERVDQELVRGDVDYLVIKEQLNQKLNDREKKIVKFFKHSNNVKVPFNRYQIVLQNKKLITIY